MINDKPNTIAETTTTMTRLTYFSILSEKQSLNKRKYAPKLKTANAIDPLLAWTSAPKGESIEAIAALSQVQAISDESFEKFLRRQKNIIPDFEKVRKNQSDSSLYHLAGDSIVVNVLMAIFKELL